MGRGGVTLRPPVKPVQLALLVVFLFRETYILAMFNDNAQ